MDCQSNMIYTVNVKTTTHAKRTALLIISVIAISIAIFVFTQPLLAPGFDIRSTIVPANSASQSNDADTIFFSNNDVPTDVGLDVQAKSFLVFNETTGEIIASKNPNTAIAIASITKLMTAFVVQKYGNLNDIWAIGPSSTNDIRPILGLSIGDRVIIQDLVNAMLIGSANDAAQSLGEYTTSITDTPIIDLMNKEADALEMNATHYENPIGFDSEQNYSTANDLKKLLDTIRPISLFSSIDRKQSYAFTSVNGNSYSVKATNTLVAQDPEIHAIKTGFTDEAGGAMITAVYHNDTKFIIIILGSPNREDDTIRIKNEVIKKIAQ